MFHQNLAQAPRVAFVLLLSRKMDLRRRDTSRLHQNVADRRRRRAPFVSVVCHANSPALRQRIGRLLQAGQHGNQLRVVALSFPSTRFDTAKYLADRIHHAQQRRGKFRVELKLSIPKPSEQVLPHVGNFFQLVEA